MFESLQIPVILTPIFLHSYSQEDLHYALNIKGINSRQCTRRIMDRLESTLLYENQESVNVRSFAIKSTYVPFKVEKCDSTANNNTRLVITHDVNLENLNEDDVERNGTETMLKKEKAVPLSMEEMDEFFTILKKCTSVNLKDESTNISKVDEIKKLGNDILENTTKINDWKLSKEQDFLSRCQLLHQLFKAAFKFRLGVVDGAHRATVIFNAIHGYKMVKEGLQKGKPVDINEWNATVTYQTQCEIWKHSEKGKKHQNVKKYI